MPIALLPTSDRFRHGDQSADARHRALNDLVVRRVDEAGLMARWCSLRLVAAAASLLMPALRLCLLSRSAAEADRRLFALFLPGPELTLDAGVHSGSVAERTVIVEGGLPISRLAPAPPARRPLSAPC